MSVALSCENRARSLASRRVLVVEDEYLISELIAEQLSELGYEVVGPALSLEEGRRLIDAAPFDIALLDWSIGGTGSSELAETLRSRDIPFLFVTGFDQPPDPRYREVAVLNKPFDLGSLKSALEKVSQGAE